MYVLNRLALTVVLSCASESAIAQTALIESEHVAEVGAEQSGAASGQAAGDVRSSCAAQVSRIAGAPVRSRG